jgi:hypothetical protein
VEMRFVLSHPDFRVPKLNFNLVVLLDEADVFLEQRTLQDLQRNALVSVFLRVLEYYDGIHIRIL